MRMRSAQYVVFSDQRPENMKIKKTKVMASQVGFVNVFRSPFLSCGLNIASPAKPNIPILINILEEMKPEIMIMQQKKASVCLEPDKPKSCMELIKGISKNLPF